MAIGTTVKVGFDATQVRAGLGKLSGMFGGVFRGFRQVGIGAVRQVGARMTDMLGRVLMAVPQGIKDTMDWAGDLDDMAVQTGMSAEKLVLLGEALRLSGAEASDTSMMISRFADNLGNAMREAGPAQEALNRLGFMASEFKGVALDEAFEKIGVRAGEMSWGMGELEATMADLFGARMGFKLIRFFKNFDTQSKQAEENVGALSRVMGKKASFYADMGDKIDRFKMKWVELMAIVIDVTNNLFGTDWVDKIFDSLDADKVRAFMMDVRDGFKIVMTKDFWKGIMGDFGRAIGDGIKQSIGDAFSLKGLFPSLTSGGGETSSRGGSEKTIARLDRQIQLLQTIATKQTGWA